MVYFVVLVLGSRLALGLDVDSVMLLLLLELGVVGLVILALLIFNYFGEDTGYLLVEHLLELLLHLCVESLLLAELLCKLLSSVSLVNHNPLKATPAHIHIHKELGLTLVGVRVLTKVNGLLHLVLTWLLHHPSIKRFLQTAAGVALLRLLLGPAGLDDWLCVLTGLLLVQLEGLGWVLVF